MGRRGGGVGRWGERGLWQEAVRKMHAERRLSADAPTAGLASHVFCCSALEVEPRA